VSAHLAQSEEEQFIRDFFAEDVSGFFVEVGVGHPTQGSQTWPLEQLGWSGVLIEPQPDLAAFLVTARSARVLAVACSSPDNAGGTLPLSVSRPSTAGDRATAGSVSETRYTLMVPVRTLDSILEEAEAPIPIDFIAVNIEGHEHQALRGFDIDRWQPQLVALGRNGGSLKAHRYLLRAGYRLIQSGAAKDWYAPNELRPRLSWRHRWDILRKFYLSWPLRALRGAMRRLRRR
jgi:FkbM family methyltransferase